MSELNLANEVLDDLKGRYITFYIDKNVYSLELVNVIEIISVQSIRSIPHTPAYVKGVMNLRGKILPVVDARLKLKLEERPYDDKTCIVVVVLDEMQVGLIVDQISDVVTIDESNIAVHPEYSAANSEKHLRSIAKVGDRMILNLDCRKFLHSEIKTSAY